MKYISICFILTVGISRINAQALTFSQVDSVSNILVSELLEQTDSILIYQTVLNVSIVSSYNDCACRNFRWLIWKTDSSTMILSLDCCSPPKTSKIEHLLLWENFKINSNLIFKSEFKSDGEMFHYIADKLTLKTDSGEDQIEARNYYFEDNYKFQNHNLEQPAKVFLDELNNVLMEILSSTKR